MLGHLVGYVGLHGGLWAELKKHPTENFLVVPNRAPNTHRFRRGRVYLES